MRLTILAALLGLTMSVQAQTAAELFTQAEKLARADDRFAALDQIQLVLDKEPNHVGAIKLRIDIYERQYRFVHAAKEFDKLMKPNDASLHFQRGLQRFKARDFEGSIADFDRQIELQPDAKISHWQRGISYYYAGKYAEGKAQFEGYQEFDSNDVENAVWRFMCMSRAEGIKKAQAAMLKIGDDKRVPMRAIYEMFLGKVQIADVIDLATRTNGDAPEKVSRQLFYAHLYVGIYYELLGDKAKALEHMERAVERPIGHYMWNVARAHYEILRARPAVSPK